jgi:hypothetical protein
MEAEPPVSIPRQGRGKYNGGRASCEHSPAEPGNEGNQDVQDLRMYRIFIISILSVKIILNYLLTKF